MSQGIELSPLQLKQVLFTEVSVSIAQPLENVEEAWAPLFEFQGVEVKFDVTLATSSENDPEDPRDYLLTVRMGISNESGKKSPYKMQVEAVGFIQVIDGIPIADREEIVRVNGASLVIGAIREMVSTISARSAFGPITLPTMRVIPNTSSITEK